MNFLKTTLLTLTLCLSSLIGFSQKPFEDKNTGKWGVKDAAGKIILKAEYDYVREFKENYAAVVKNKKCGFIDKNGQLVIEIKYDAANDFNDGMAIINIGCVWEMNANYEQECNGGTFGFINTEGKEIFGYESAGDFVNGLAPVKRSEKWGYINKKGEESIEFMYDDVGLFTEDGLARVSKDGKWGFIDLTGKEAIPLTYELVDPMENGLARIKENGKWGWIDKNGKVVIAFKYDDARTYTEDGLARVSKDGKWGFIDLTGKEAIPLTYELVDPMENGLARIKENGKWGWIDKNGKVVIDVQYDSTSVFENGFSLVNVGGRWDTRGNFEGGKWWLISQTGATISEKYDEIYIDASQKLMTIVLNKKYGMMDQKGKVIVPTIYDDMSYSCNTGMPGGFVNGFVGVRKNRKWGYMNEAGKVIIPLMYDEIHEFKDGLAAVGKGGTILDSSKIYLPWSVHNPFKNSKYGFIDKTGNTIIPFTYDGIMNGCNHDAGFYSGLAVVYKNGKYGFINKFGKVVIPFTFDDVYTLGFSDGKAEVVKDGRTFLIDKTGKEIKE